MTPLDVPRLSNGPSGMRAILRAVQSAIKLNSCGAPFGVRGLYADVLVLGHTAATLLPLRELLHPAAIALAARTIPSLGSALAAASMRACREATKRVNLAWVVFEEQTTGQKTYSPADAKAMQTNITLVEDVKAYARRVDQHITDEKLLGRVLRIKGQGELALNSDSTDQEISEAVSAAALAFEHDSKTLSALDNAPALWNELASSRKRESVLEANVSEGLRYLNNVIETAADEQPSLNIKDIEDAQRKINSYLKDVAKNERSLRSKVGKKKAKKTKRVASKSPKRDKTAKDPKKGLKRAASPKSAAAKSTKSNEDADDRLAKRLKIGDGADETEPKDEEVLDQSSGESASKQEEENEEQSEYNEGDEEETIATDDEVIEEAELQKEEAPSEGKKEAKGLSAKKALTAMSRLVQKEQPETVFEGVNKLRDIKLGEQNCKKIIQELKDSIKQLSDKFGKGTVDWLVKRALQVGCFMRKLDHETLALSVCGELEAKYDIKSDEEDVIWNLLLGAMQSLVHCYDA